MAESTGGETAAKTEKVVRYVGTADVREISEAAFEQVGVKQKDARWDRSNRFQIPAKEFSKEALAYFENEDAGFEIVEA